MVVRIVRLGSPRAAGGGLRLFARLFVALLLVAAPKAAAADAWDGTGTVGNDACSIRPVEAGRRGLTLSSTHRMRAS